MDPITAIVTALALGASEGLKPAATQAIKDLYSGLKSIIQHKYAAANNSLEALEKMPESSNKRGSLQEDLATTNALQDEQLLQQAQALLTAIKDQVPQAAQAIGIKLEDIEAANVRLRDITARGQQAAGVSIKGAKVVGDIDISGVNVTASNETK
jgi:hypothetical protein